MPSRRTDRQNTITAVVDESERVVIVIGYVLAARRTETRSMVTDFQRIRRSVWNDRSM